MTAAVYKALAFASTLTRLAHLLLLEVSVCVSLVVFWIWKPKHEIRCRAYNSLDLLAIGGYEANERVVSTLLAIGPHFTLSVSRTFPLLLCLR